MRVGAQSPLPRHSRNEPRWACIGCMNTSGKAGGVGEPPGGRDLQDSRKADRPEPTSGPAPLLAISTPRADHEQWTSNPPETCIWRF